MPINSFEANTIEKFKIINNADKEIILIKDSTTYLETTKVFYNLKCNENRIILTDAELIGLSLFLTSFINNKIL